MSGLSRSLIAAAGNAAGGLSYWVDRVQTSSSYTPTLRSVVNTTNENIVITNGEQLSSHYFVELDYDGGLISSSEYTMAADGTKSTLLAIDSNNYNFFPQTTTNLRYVNLDNTSSSTLSSKYNSTYMFLGRSNYDAVSFTADFDQETATDFVVLVRGGSVATYFTGYGEYYQEAVGVGKINMATGSISEEKFNLIGYSSGDYAARDAVVAHGTGQKYCVFWQSVTEQKTKFATYTTQNGVNNPFYNLVQYTYAPDMKAKGIFIDSTDKVTAVSARTTSQTWIWRAEVSGVYEPTKRYSYPHGAALAHCSSSAMDADGNVYIYYQNGQLVKFSSSNTIEWCLRIDNTLVGYEAGNEYINEIKVQSIDDTEFLLMSLVFPIESGSNYCWYIIKAPLDLNNYLGTYGNIQISNYSFSPTVTTHNHTRNSAGGGIGNGFGSFSTNNVSNASASVSVTTTDI
jgi:hypothetical protein